MKRGAERREQIIAKAIRAIGERGFFGFTILELARQCGLSNAGLLHHFPSKVHLLMAVLDEIEAREADIMMPLVQAAMEGGRGDLSRDAVVGVLRAMIARVVARPELGRLFAELQVESLTREHPAHEWWQRRDAQLIEMLTGLIAPHVADAEATATLMAATLDGLLLRWLRSARTVDIKTEWDRALGQLLPSLAEALAADRPEQARGRTPIRQR